MKYLTSLALAVLMPAMAATAADGYLTSMSSGIAIGTSANGDKVFGYNGRSGADAMSTWIYDIATKEKTQLTEYKEDVLDSGGQISWINSGGTMTGTIRDMEWVAPKVQGENYEVVENYPLATACIWKDGNLLKLDHNEWEDPASFGTKDDNMPALNNGFYGIQISDDESLVVGYVKAFTYMRPVRWKLNSEGKYVSTMLPREKFIEFFYAWVGASADCRMVIMNTAQSGGKSYIWIDDNEPVIFNYAEQGSKIEEPVLTALSPSGRYAIMRCTRDGSAACGVYDFSTGDIRWIPVPEGAKSSNWFAANVITDRGDGFICDYDYKLHYFNLDLGINIPMKAYLSAFGSDIDMTGASVPSKALARMISGDGRTICGNTLAAGNEDKGWIVSLPENKPMLFNLKNCQALFDPDFNVLVKWNEPELPDGATLNHYIVKIDDKEYKVENPVKGEDGMLRAELETSGNKHAIDMYAIATDKDGKEWESVHQSLSMEMSANTALFFFEDLYDSTIDETVMAYIYEHDTFTSATPDNSDTLSFRLDGGDFQNLSPFWYTCGFARSNWNTWLESRWFDARDCKEDIYFTWQERNMPINYAYDRVASNRLMVEYTVDGENWLPLHESDGKTNDGKWNVQVVDLSDLCGQRFRLRFHACGTGEMDCEWRVDYYGIKPASCMYDAPAGLMVTSETKSEISLAWQNNRGEYEVSYNYNSPFTYNSNVGNNGEDLYVACDYGPSKLNAFDGKYMTAVSTMLYEPSDIGQSWHTTVEAMVFDSEGNELSRGMLSDDAPWYEDDGVAMLPIHHINLDTPVLVEAGKTYRVAIKISDYDSKMCPIWYFSASDDYIPGVTDLYSDDNLASWNSYSDFISMTAESEEEFNAYGRCIFNIRPCISDKAEIPTQEYEQLQWFYQVYRDGELLPHGIAYYTQQSVSDSKAEGSSYTVRSFRRDGSVSRMSDPMVYHASGINNVAAEGGNEIDVVKTETGYHVEGDYDSVMLYTAAGVKVAEGADLDTRSLPRGFYIIVVQKDGKRASYKIGI